MLGGIDKQTTTGPQHSMQRAPTVLGSDSLSIDDEMESHAGGDGDQGIDTTQETLQAVSL